MIREHGAAALVQADHAAKAWERARELIRDLLNSEAKSQAQGR